MEPPQSKRPLTPEQELTVDELLEFYNISDPVYQGLIRWRVAILQEWRTQWLGNIVNVLEIGTGHYPFTLSFGTSCRDMDFTGIETDANMSARARQHLAHKFRSATVLSSRWDSNLTQAQGWQNKFDLVTTFEVFEHVPAEEEFLINVRRVLRPGGYLILETPNANVTPLFVRVFGHPPDGGGEYMDKDHVNELGFRTLFRELRASGFDVIDFDCYYLPFSLWDDRSLEPYRAERLYELIHRAAGHFPFYSYVQAFIARKHQSRQL